MKEEIETRFKEALPAITMLLFSIALLSQVIFSAYSRESMRETTTLINDRLNQQEESIQLITKILQGQSELNDKMLKDKQ